jgi:RNA polymerase sigma-70 factor (ECF subfamily)
MFNRQLPNRPGASPEGQVQSFEELGLPLLESLYNFAHWLTRNREDAEDLVQETYVKALKNFKTFQPGTNFKAWMFRIARNHFLNSRTGLKASRTISLNEDEYADLATTSRTPELLAVIMDDREQIHCALERLPLHYRQVILLCDIEELKYREVAQILDIPVGTVMSRIARGRAILRQLLLEQQRSQFKTARDTPMEAPPRAANCHGVI